MGWTARETRSGARCYALDPASSVPGRLDPALAGDLRRYPTTAARGGPLGTRSPTHPYACQGGLVMTIRKVLAWISVAALAATLVAVPAIAKSGTPLTIILTRAPDFTEAGWSASGAFTDAGAWTTDKVSRRRARSPSLSRLSGRRSRAPLGPSSSGSRESKARQLGIRSAVRGTSGKALERMPACMEAAPGQRRTTRRVTTYSRSSAQFTDAAVGSASVPLRSIAALLSRPARLDGPLRVAPYGRRPASTPGTP
jgi:hypothetical protein